MTHPHPEETISVPRNRIFVLLNGAFVVQWEENRVQNLLTGRYQTYDSSEFGNAITDYELNQLLKSGIVDDYDTELVYLHATVTPTQPTRTYYLNTKLHKSNKDKVEAALREIGATDRLSVRIQGIFVIIRGKTGLAFPTFDAAEKAREWLVNEVPELLDQTAVAFVETSFVS